MHRTVAHRREIRSRVQIAAIALLYDHRCFEFVEKDAFRAIRFRDQVRAFQISYYLWQIIVVAALRIEVRIVQRDAQSLVHRSAMRQGDVYEAPPVRPHVLVAALQGDHCAARAVREIDVRVETLARLRVEHLQVLELGCGFLHILKMGNQHAELRAPVAHVILSNYAVTERFENARHGIPDRRPQVPNMHFLGQVGSRIVHYDPVGIRGSIDLDSAQVRADKRGGQRDIDETGTGDREVLGELRIAQCVYDGRREDARWGSRCLCGRHGAIRLIVAKFRTRGDAYQWLCVSGARRLECRRHAPMQERPEIHSSWVETSSARDPRPRSTATNVTRAPSRNSRSPVPSARMLRRCTKMSPPASRMMKPNPFVGSNHLTIPLSRSPAGSRLARGWRCRARTGCSRAFLRAPTLTAACAVTKQARKVSRSSPR